MSDKIEFVITHPTGEVETHFFDVPVSGQETILIYTSAEKGGPVYTPKHRPAGA